VEDEESLRSAIVMALRRHGYRVHEAANGAEALVLWGKHRDETVRKINGFDKLHFAAGVVGDEETQIEDLAGQQLSRRG